MQLKILTPTKIFYDEDITSLVLRSTEGELGIRPGHIGLTCGMDYCIIRISTGEDEPVLATIMGGFAEITPRKITLITDAAEWTGEVDIDRAECAKERAKKRLDESSEQLDRERACRAMQRAEIRLKTGLLRK